ncbi:MAG: DNA repair protein RadA [Clostridia bacterium]|nr:DNA repair protein RadA [Clostridia bacterium]
MSKMEKTVYVCGECGYETPRWMGRCPQCGSWNTLVEQERVAPRRKTGSAAPKAVPLQTVSADAQKRSSTGIKELDRVLGGGLVDGMVVLIGGDPGVGKSTLLLEAADELSRSRTVLYVSGEESRSQIKLRAERLGIRSDPLLYCETSVENAIEEAKAAKARVLIVDSVQTMQSETAESAAGSVTQVRAVTAVLTRYAKETGTVVLIVGHVTKDGAIAGPRVLEHIVDTVLYFEGERREGLRLLRAVKNRFGSTNELGVFEMRDDGMREVPDPSALFVSGKNAVGCAITCVLEGSRPLLCEVQSLLCPNAFGSPRRTAIGLDTNRLNLLLAVLERKARLKFSDKDVYCDVAGSLRVLDRGADLATAMCLASALLEKPLPEKTVLIGEVGLTGEIRPVSQLDTRIREAVRLGYTTILLPPRSKTSADGFRAILVSDISEAIRALFLSE